jgi:hypothetical protein
MLNAYLLSAPEQKVSGTAQLITLQSVGKGAGRHKLRAFDG